MTTCASAAAPMCGAETVTPTTRAIAPMKPQGTARAAATAPLIGNPAEGNANLCVVSAESPRTRDLAGQGRRSYLSAVTPIADKRRCGRIVRFVPEADIARPV